MKNSPLIVPLVDEGLGNSAYLVDLGDGRALAVDPSRDLRSLREAAGLHSLTVAFTAETHLHADFLTGSVQLAADQGAQVLGSATGHRRFDHRGLVEGDEVDLGGLTLRALVTPGHTPEHLSYLLMDGSEQLAVFTGGSLIVGAAARTDLAGAENTEALTRAQYRSLHRLVDELDDETAVLPTHGAGSFCSAPPGAARTTTIGEQRATNPLLAAPDEDAFVRTLLDSLGSYPAYFGRLGELNRRGPAVLSGTPGLAPLTVEQVVGLQGEGAQVIDARPITEFAAGHVPGSLSIELRAAFATWLGWLTDPTRPVVIVRNPDQDPDEIVWQALKVGVEQLAGELGGGLAAWQAAGGTVRSLPLIEAAHADPTRVVDIRQRNEFAAGHLPGARNAELATVSTAGLTGPLQTICGHGERAATAASLLAASGCEDVSIVTGGPGDWSAAHGASLEVGP
ncbi:MAG: rhodanese-like domain-containing protein [Mycobacteriales bacterium]|nr:rhodanese-like domain-containing protein [Mycobacteriales bacterium]